MVDPPYPLEYGTVPRLLIRSTLNFQEGTGMLYTVRTFFLWKRESCLRLPSFLRFNLFLLFCGSK